MATVNVNLTPELAEFVSTEVASGDYVTASELVRDALRNLCRDRELEVQKIELLRRKLSVGLDQPTVTSFPIGVFLK